MARRARFGLSVAALVVAVASTSACPAADDDDAPTEILDLAVPEAWQTGEAGGDPLAAHRPAMIDCADDATAPEGLGLEIDTTACNYVDLVQPSRQDVAPGDAIGIEILHYDLRAIDPSEAHIAIALGGAVVWETTLPIPSDAEVIEAAVPVDLDAPAGTEVRLHLHNHGYNTYDLLSLTVRR